ncbi:hypothetical protein ACVC7V_09785 [Hydrogenophaga sp. A37]|uniref:hypothetical protein n=1 Tax=Hydrogenophaga sp. A37 TaxID=1945864 RepID=UPI001179E017|nr:hypothetical protein [Hydrogenophaga sp. A37]
MSLPRRLSAWVDGLPPRAITSVLVMLGVLLAARLLGMTWLLSVNVPFSDQWALLTRLYNGFQWSDVPVAFVWQHGPHRQGLSFAMVLPAYHLSDWNVRLDSFWIACVQLASGALALRLRRQLLPGSWSIWDALLLLAFWGVSGFETLWVAPNASHSIFPLCLLMLLVNVWLWTPGWARTAVVAALVVALGFTGFGLTALPALALVLLLEAWRGAAARRRHALVLLATCFLTVAAFLVDYRFVVSAEGFQSMRPNPLDYLPFMAAMLSYFVLMVQRASGWFIYPVGAVFLLAMLGAFVVGLRPLSARSGPSGHEASERLWQVCVILLGCSLVFALLTAYGRVQLGVEAATASRYTALVLPAVAALHLLLFRHRERAAPLMLVLLLIFVVRAVPETRRAYQHGRYFASVKLCWLEQYLANGHNVPLADAQLLRLDPARAYQAGWMGQQKHWDFMEKWGLGPMSASASPAPLLGFYPQPCERLKGL